MAFEINIHVTKYGKLETSDLPLVISVFKESKRVKLNFTVDAEVDSAYHYLKFTHPNTSYLYRVHENTFEIPKAITAWEGRWEMSFVCCDEPANSDNTITANYIYASEPVMATIMNGNLGNNSSTEEQNLLKQLVEGTFSSFEIPTSASFIGSYFLSDCAQAFTITIPASILTIKDHAFYNSGCTSIIFEEGSQVKTLEDNALYRIASLGDMTFPKSIDSWGKYNLGSCGCGIVQFEATSNLRTLSSYAFWAIPNLTKLYLPDRLQTLSGGTSVIKSCPLLNEVWIPNTVVAAIPANAIADCPLLNKITLQTSFNASANFASVTALTKESIVLMFRALKDLTGAGAKVLTLGAVNLAKCTQEELDIALNKNWSLA